MREFLLFSDCLVWLADDRGGNSEHRARRPIMRRGRSKSEAELPTVNKVSITEQNASADEKWSFKGRAELVDLEVVVNPAGRDEDERTGFDVLSPEVSFAAYAGEWEVWRWMMGLSKSLFSNRERA